ncbi:hypothetical protein [Paenibacillus monticola]|uniref:Uncharacterized protein n=1 Tax=Paenibacillus monticola TaxID=2666075 RepID=A0A7X2H6Q7_9BACL|nr:hypothetical protein [Paenibacillus monticola]MRN54569.1 hypothetical protein [Paenibacillus monticola]
MSVQDGYSALMMASQKLYIVVLMFIFTVGAWLSMNINIAANFNININVSIHLFAVAGLAFELSSLTSS